MARDHDSDDNENKRKWVLMFSLYAIISLQFLLAVSVGSVVISNSRIPHFVLHTAPGLAIYILSIVFCIIIQCVLLDLRGRWPWNYILFILWTILFASTVGLSCSYSNGRGKAVLETIILISVVAVVLGHHSYYSMHTERDFSLCELLSISVFLVACVYIPIQVFHPFAKLSISIYAFLVAIAFAGRMYIAETFFINNQFDDPIGAAVIVHLIFLMNNPNREELTSRRAIRVPLRNP
ncbi:uncharacterized protein LOC110418983 [Herrania umbratica]|uniref:Uncharacterized protein LOC110418983 n=1 Tax=Herrania umbratica TaxID=108875 RepID=A0A6J1AKN6_9ROSI|nr:uncharacterized protein LOC110418983 [Herrania umbratica]